MAESLIPGLNALYGILKRHIERGNDELKQRKELAQEVRDSCHHWSKLLVKMIDDVVEQWERNNRSGAIDSIMRLTNDFHEIDYWSLDESSPILKFLKKDPRFRDFAIKCAGFYKSALDLKRLAYGEIKDRHGMLHNAATVGLPTMAHIWREEVRERLRCVTTAHNYVKTIVPA